MFKKLVAIGLLVILVVAIVTISSTVDSASKDRAEVTIEIISATPLVNADSFLEGKYTDLYLYIVATNPLDNLDYWQLPFTAVAYNTPKNTAAASLSKTYILKSAPIVSGEVQIRINGWDEDIFSVPDDLGDDIVKVPADGRVYKKTFTAWGVVVETRIKAVKVTTLSSPAPTPTPVPEASELEAVMDELYGFIYGVDYFWFGDLEDQGTYGALIYEIVEGEVPQIEIVGLNEEQISVEEFCWTTEALGLLAWEISPVLSELEIDAQELDVLETHLAHITQVAGASEKYCGKDDFIPLELALNEYIEWLYSLREE